MKIPRLPPTVRWYALLLLVAGMVSAQPTIYVFVPSMQRPNAIQTAIQERCPGTVVTVFGRQADLHRQMSAAPPDVLVAPGAVVGAFPGFSVALQGLRGGQPQGPLKLLAPSVMTPAQAVAGASGVGVVQVLTRPETNRQVQGWLGAPVTRLKTVTKVEDLLPLLSFQGADAVVLPEYLARELRASSQATLHLSPVANATWMHTQVAVSQGAGAATAVAALRGLQAAQLVLLGVEAWR